MTKREYKVSRIYRESSPRENEVTRKISVFTVSQFKHFIKPYKIWWEYTVCPMLFSRKTSFSVLIFCFRQKKKQLKGKKRKRNSLVCSLYSWHWGNRKVDVLLYLSNATLWFTHQKKSQAISEYTQTPELCEQRSRCNLLNVICLSIQMLMIWCSLNTHNCMLH